MEAPKTTTLVVSIILMGTLAAFFAYPQTTRNRSEYSLNPDWINYIENYYYESVYSVFADDGYIYATGSAGKYIFLIKLDSTFGIQIWERFWKKYSEEANENNYPQSMFVDSGNIYIGGVHKSNKGRGGVLLKYNVDGEYLWHRVIAESEEITSVCVKAGGTYYTGRNASTILLHKCDGNGNLIWNTTWRCYSTYYHPKWDPSLVVDLEAIYILYMSPYRDVQLTKYSTNGTQIWDRSWGTPDNDYPASISVSNGYVYITGFNESFRSREGTILIPFLIKYDLDGDLIWNKTWGEQDKIKPKSISINQADICIVGSAKRGHNYDDGFVAKLDTDGNTRWIKTWGTNHTMEFANSVCNDGDAFYIGGYFYSNRAGTFGDGFIIKYSGDGPSLDVNQFVIVIIIIIESIALIYFITKHHLHKKRISEDPELTESTETTLRIVTIKDQSIYYLLLPIFSLLFYGGAMYFVIGSWNLMTNYYPSPPEGNQEVMYICSTAAIFLIIFGIITTYASMRFRNWSLLEVGYLYSQDKESNKSFLIEAIEEIIFTLDQDITAKGEKKFGWMDYFAGWELNTMKVNVYLTYLSPLSIGIGIYPTNTENGKKITKRIHQSLNESLYLIIMDEENTQLQ